MSVRLKIISIIVLTLLVFGVTLYVVGSQILIKNYVEIEREGVIRNLDRVSDAVINVSNQLEVKISDWATWDDTYEFIKDKNKAYIKSNLTIVALENLEIQGMLFYDTKGKLVYSNFLDTDIISSKKVEKYFEDHSDLVVHEGIDSSKSGMVSLEDENLVIASKPIVTSEGEGPVGGTIVFVKHFGKDEVKKLGDLTHVTVNLLSYNLDNPFVEKAKENITKDSNHFVLENSTKLINGYSIINDIDGSPILMIEVQMHRAIFLQGQETIFYFMLLAGLFGSFFGVFLILLIEKIIIQRLTFVGRQARAIGESRDFEKRIKVSGKDEIAILSKSINEMLDDLKNSEDAKEEVLAKNVKISKKLVEHAEELEKFNRLMVGRELRMIELKNALREGSKMHQEKTKKKEK